MRVREHDAVSRSKAGKIVATLGELVRSLAVDRAVLGNRLIERHQRAAAAVGKQHNLGDTHLSAQKIDARLDVERQLLEIDQRLVVLVARVHAQQQETATRQLSAGAMVEEVRGAMHDENADVRRRPGVGSVERALADSLKG